MVDAPKIDEYDHDDDEYDHDVPGFPGSRQETDPKLRASLVPLSGVDGAATIVTEMDAPDRYLLPLDDDHHDWVMIDAPPYSPRLHLDMMRHMQTRAANHTTATTTATTSTSTPHSTEPRLVALLVTNKDSLHYDTAPRTPYRSSKSELEAWCRAFPGLHVVAHRIDVPRDSQPFVTQRLDGYGPWAWNGTAMVETGRPLRVLEWDEDLVNELLKNATHTDTASETELRRRITQNEAGRHLLAVYTPGHTMGSVCYVLPRARVCASGLAVPTTTTSSGDGGPSYRLDAKGYVSTNRGTVRRQVESARLLADHYVDRFDVVLPSRNGPMRLLENGGRPSPPSNNHHNDDDDDHDDEEQSRAAKRRQLEEAITQFEIIGNIYDSLGIMPSK